MPQLDPTWFASQLFWLAVCFTTLYLLLSRVILPPLQGVIASRKGAIESDLVVAQDLKSQAELAKQSYESTLVKSREAAQSIIGEADSAAKKRAEEAKRSLETQISIQLANATAAIDAKKQELLKELLPSSVELSSLIVEKLTEQKPTAEQLKRATNLQG